VRDDLRRRLQQAGAPSGPIDVLPMGWEIPPPAADDDAVLQRHRLEKGKYFLQVGTFEPRKNHIALVRAVERLRQKHGAAMPACVFVGAKGWRSGALIRHLERTRFADGAIRWLRGVRDGDLGALYRGALFTVYPSLMEGWGLPVQESLSHGVPCIASHAGAIPEAGLDLAVYVDPADETQLTAAIDRWLGDPSALAAARARVAAFLKDGARLPTWRDAAGTVLEAATHARQR
jgi:glycosyltransferase involved in cell wall biosynthesis